MNAIVSKLATRFLARSDFREAQTLVHAFMGRVRKCGIFADMGLGKTGAVILFLVDLFNRFEVDRVLVIAPLNVARWTWPAELALWLEAKALTHDVLWKAKPGKVTPTRAGAHRLRHWEAKLVRLDEEIADLELSVVTPKDLAELAALRREFKDAKRTLKWGHCAAKRPADIHIINRENSAFLVKFWGKYWPYDVVIYDESSDLKNGRKVLRWRAMRQIMGVTKRFVELTGTYAPKGVMDLWGQIYVLDGGERLGRTITEFRKRFFDRDYTGYVYDLKPGAMEEVTAAISDICIRLEADDFMDLPPTLYNSIPVVLDEEELATYRTLAKEYLVTLPDGGEIEILASIAKTTKLLQLANGMVYDGERYVHNFHNKKIAALRDYIDERQGHNVLVAYWFQHDFEELKKAFPHARVFHKEETLIAEWNEGQVSLMLIHPGSGGHGLNIQFGGRRLLWYGPIPTQDLELYQQMNDRLAHARAVGQGTTFIDHLCAVDTVDYDVVERLKMNAQAQKAIGNLLKTRNTTKS